jgi:recombinational DNA repair protein (RecF pathway)
MIEVISEAIVLDKEDLGECDSRVFLYTKDLGKISAKTISSRKITSKLASHIEPANYITARLISKRDFFDGRGFQLVDALMIDGNRLKSEIKDLKEAIKVLDFIKYAAPEGVSDSDLWDFLRGIISKSINVKIKDAVAFLGFDPEFASCEICGRTKPEYFYVKSSFFVCNSCLLLANEANNQFIKI